MNKSIKTWKFPLKINVNGLSFPDMNIFQYIQYIQGLIMEDLYIVKSFTNI